MLCGAYLSVLRYPKLSAVLFSVLHFPVQIIGFYKEIIALAVSSASLPYSSIVLWPTCQGPSISFPRHHVLNPYGSFCPCLIRRLLHFVPPGWLQYSNQKIVYSKAFVKCRSNVSKPYCFLKITVLYFDSTTKIPIGLCPDTRLERNLL